LANIVLGMGTSHGPMLSTPPEGWGLRVPADRANRQFYKGKTWSFDELVLLRKSEKLEQQISMERWRERHAACRAAIDKMAAVFAAVKPDVAVLVGNDQMECFSDTLMPAFGILWGETIVNSMYSEERLAALPPGIGVSVAGHIPPGGAVYPAVSALGQHLIRCAIRDQFDVAAMKKLPRDETPHAFGFVFRQIMCDRPVPSVPVILNTFYPPNQPTVRRCYDFGRSLVRAIQSWESDARVALIASGGLTHFVIDEEVDSTVLQSMRSGSVDNIAALGEEVFQDGTSEIKNWIPVAGAMAELGFNMTVVDYIPCYRSVAGTGNAMGFVHWLP
jgi:hypothetical protein